jgi:hypothetical protein
MGLQPEFGLNLVTSQRHSKLFASLPWSRRFTRQYHEFVSAQGRHRGHGNVGKDPLPWGMYSNPNGCVQEGCVGGCSGRKRDLQGLELVNLVLLSIEHPFGTDFQRHSRRMQAARHHDCVNSQHECMNSQHSGPHIWHQHQTTILTHRKLNSAKKGGLIHN